MRLICPDCRGDLQMSGRRTAKCPLHGGEYEVLFDREAELLMHTAERNALASMPPAEEKMCAAHPRQNAVADCETCGKALCAVCSFDVNGRHFCGDCAVNGAKTAPPAPPVQKTSAPLPHETGFPTIFSPTETLARSVPVGLKCVQHPESEVVAQCRGCAGGVCATCDFVFAGEVHVCPQCIDRAGDDEVSPRRKKFITISMVLAVVSTLLFIVVMAGGSEMGEQVAGVLLIYGVAVPAVIGGGLGLSAHERNLRNTPLMWAAAVWNGLIVVVILILIFVGLFMS